MRTWSDPTFDLTDAQRLHFTIHDVPFAVHSNDAAVLDHIARLVQRYRTEPPGDAPGPEQVLIAVQGTPTVQSDRLIDVPRRSGTRKTARIATAEIEGGRVIFRRETGVLTAIQPDAWTITGDLRTYPGEVTRVLDAMLSLALVDRGYLTLKGSALARDGRGIALVGGPDTARRALAVTLVGRGFQWVTEDLLQVRVASGHVEMRGLPGLLRLGPAAMLAHPALHAMLTAEEQARYAGQTWRDLREIEARYNIDTVDAFGPAGIASGGTLDMIVALRWRGGETAGEPAIALLARADAYEALADATRSFGLYDLAGSVPPNFHRLQRIAETVAMHTVSGPVDLLTVADTITTDVAQMATQEPTALTNGVH